jgi:hypothetical protein
MTYLTTDAKAKLSSTIRSLRQRLLTDLHNAAESAYRLSIAAAAQAGLAEAQREKRQRLEGWLAEQVRADLAGQKRANRPKKDYDWAHLAARYFPQRVDAKCQQDPSLAVAHGVFWKYHPAKAYEWELRLQDEIGLDFTLDELESPPFKSHRKSRGSSP